MLMFIHNFMMVTFKYRYIIKVKVLSFFVFLHKYHSGNRACLIHTP